MHLVQLHLVRLDIHVIYPHSSIHDEGKYLWKYMRALKICCNNTWLKHIFTKYRTWIYLRVYMGTSQVLYCICRTQSDCMGQTLWKYMSALQICCKNTWLNCTRTQFRIWTYLCVYLGTSHVFVCTCRTQSDSMGGTLLKYMSALKISLLKYVIQIREKRIKNPDISAYVYWYFSCICMHLHDAVGLCGSDTL